MEQVKKNTAVLLWEKGKGAYGVLAERSRRRESYNRAPAPPAVEKTYVTIFTGIVVILKNLRQHKSVTLKELYDDCGRSKKVALFLAVLELSKEGTIRISDDGESITLAR